MLSRERLPSHRAAFITVMAMGIALLVLVMPVAAATTSVTVTKYADNNYSQSVDSQTLSLAEPVTGEYAAQRFVFNVTESAGNIEKLAVTWVGTSSHDDSSVDQGATTYIWKDGTSYEALTGDITSDIVNYVVNGNVTALVKQNVTHVYEEEEDLSSRVATDYVGLVATHHHAN